MGMINNEGFVKLRLWVCRNEDYAEEYDDGSYTDIDGELMVCYDQPLLEYDGRRRRHVWTCASVMTEVPKYMFPQVKSGECVEFSALVSE